MTDFNQLRNDIKTQIQSDREKLQEAIRLIAEVNETYHAAWCKNVKYSDNIQTSLNVSKGSVALKLARCVSDIKVVESALGAIQERSC